MPLIIPTTSSTFADSSVTMGDPLGRKYVLAQFRIDANFDWVRETRSSLVREELKYTDIEEHEARLRQNRILWSRIESGVGQASIIVIDSDRIRDGVLAQAISDGAKLIDIEANFGSFVDQCATAIIGSTPVAYLPANLMKVVPWRHTQLFATLDRFTPEHIRKQIGGGLKQAQIFAARAHAIFDVATEDSAAVHTGDVFQSPAARLMLTELLATSRTFDAESPATLPLLNEAAQEISNALSTYVEEAEDGIGGWAVGNSDNNDALSPASTMSRESPRPVGNPVSLVKEADSRSRDELQAADVAAGWARHVLDRGGERALGHKFERVWINGKRLK